MLTWQIVQDDEPLRLPELSQFLNITDEPFKPNTSFQPISTDAFALNGAQSPIPLDLKPLIVYDTECVMVVYRVKSRATSLASTKIFCWVGKSWQENAHERRKMNELANRYSAPLVSLSREVHHACLSRFQIHCLQGNESGEFLYVIGSILVSRDASDPRLLLMNCG
jgi:hypothetical protein